MGKQGAIARPLQDFARSGLGAGRGIVASIVPRSRAADHHNACVSVPAPAFLNELHSCVNSLNRAR